MTSRQAIATEIKRPLGGFHFAADSLSFCYNPHRGLQEGVSDAKAPFAQHGIIIVRLFHPYQPVLCNLFDRFHDQGVCVRSQRNSVWVSARLYLTKSDLFGFFLVPEIDADTKEYKFQLTGRSTQRPGESPGNPVWSSLQKTHSILVCGDSSTDKMADILFPSFLLAIES